MSQHSRKLDGDYRTDEAVVSVWIGTFPDKETCRRYFHQDRQKRNPDGFPTCRFWQDLGIDWFDHDFEESSGYVGDPLPAEELLGRNFSFIGSFWEPLLAACRAKGVASGNIVIFLYEFDYPAKAGFSCPHLTFMGVFPYSREG